MNAMLMQYFNY